jgi:hypothetical protein
MTYRTWIFHSLALCLFLSNAWGQDNHTTNTTWQWGVSSGYNHYQEPGLMQLQGPELGIHASVTTDKEWSNARLETDVLLGIQRYSSENTGSMAGVRNLETRWRVLWPFWDDGSNRLSGGVAIHSLWNDLRGTTVQNGKTYTGYERLAAQIWLPLRWELDAQASLDAGVLLYGQHTSKLSQANEVDVTNTQRHGQYVQANYQVPLVNGDRIKPFVRWTHLADSDIQGTYRRYEPASIRWQVGVIWEFAGR